MVQVVMFIAAVLVSALTTPAIAGYFPSRPPDAQLQYFTGVIKDYALGNGIGGFSLTVGAASISFHIGLPMKMNGDIVRCQSPDPAVEFGFCTDWPSEIVEGKSVVTATCWVDTEFKPGISTLFCDKIEVSFSGS
jgi:hypothetical protein